VLQRVKKTGNRLGPVAIARHVAGEPVAQGGCRRLWRRLRLGERLDERAPLAHAIRLDQFEAGFRQTGQIDQRNFGRTGGIAREFGLIRVGPALHIGAALAEAGIDALLDLAPFVVVDDLGGDLDALGVIVEGDRGNLPRRDLAMHGAQIAEALASGGLGGIRRPLLVKRLGAGVIADFAGLVRQFGCGVAIDQATGGVRLAQGYEHLQRVRHAWRSSLG
jgi:hypothetical protein